MKRMNAIESLDVQISLMETEHANAEALLRKQITETAENLRPGAIIRNMFRNDKGKEEHVGLSDAAIGIATGFLVKKILFGSLHNPVFRIAGSILQAGVTNFVAKHPEPVKKGTSWLVNRLSGKKKTGDDGKQEPFEKNEK
jgi:hypothetical protein